MLCIAVYEVFRLCLPSILSLSVWWPNVTTLGTAFCLRTAILKYTGPPLLGASPPISFLAPLSFLAPDLIVSGPFCPLRQKR